MTKVTLPAIIPTTSPTLDLITKALGVPRDVLASDEEITRAWSELPRLITIIPPGLRSELHVRMCVAVGTGLFDSAINYAWNSAILELRQRVRDFGLHVVAQIKQRSFDEEALLDLKDADLLALCLDLNLISEDAYFFLDQCRDVRNNFSSAHPPVGKLDADEFVVFLSRCVKYALTASSNPKGVDMLALIGAVKGVKFSNDQRKEWAERLGATHDAQRELIFSTLHGIYCDPSSSEEARLNALLLCQAFADRFSSRTRSELINRHSDYIASGEKGRQAASQQFFEKLGLLQLLNQAEQHAIVSHACQRLVSVHQGWDNFHNEPPFAERLAEIAAQISIPDSAKPEFVTAVVTCATGNPYGVSRAAYPYYAKMIRGFSPREITFMLVFPTSHTIVGARLKSYESCRKRFRALVALLDAESVPTSHKQLYEEWAAAQQSAGAVGPFV